jgi:hypothetical protein
MVESLEGGPRRTGETVEHRPADRRPLHGEVETGAGGAHRVSAGKKLIGVERAS